MRIPFRRRPASTSSRAAARNASRGVRQNRHAELFEYRVAPVQETCAALIAERRYTEACELYAKQASAARELIKLEEGNGIPAALSMRPGLDMRLAWSLEQICLWTGEIGLLDEALRCNAEAVLIYRRLTAADPWFGQFLAMGLLERANSLLELPDMVEAVKALDEAVEVIETVTRQVPDIYQDNSDLVALTRDRIAEAT